MGHSPGIVQEKTINLILYLLNLTKIVLKNRHKFKYPDFIYLTM